LSQFHQAALEESAMFTVQASQLTAKRLSKITAAIVAGAAGLFSAQPSEAGVIVNALPSGSFPGSPNVLTVTPGQSISATRVISTRNQSQTFAVPTGFQLDKLYIGYVNATPGNVVTLQILQIPDVDEPASSSPTSPTVLVSQSFTVPANADTAGDATASESVMEFDLTGADEIFLNASNNIWNGTSGAPGDPNFSLPTDAATVGNGYAVKFVSTTPNTVNGSPGRDFDWTVTDGTVQGANPVTGVYLNGRGYGGLTQSHDLTLAIVGVPEPTALGLLGTGGALLLGRRRKVRN
jgi:hypothetical protein